MFEWFIIVLLGLVFGSFANVCIYRMPRDLSVVKPRSSCPKCNKLIAWYDNIPVISYILLGAKCRNCGTKISIRYPIIEASCALLFALVYYSLGNQYILPAFLFLAFCLLVSTAIDFEFQIIPDEFSISLIVVGLLTSFINVFLASDILHRILESFLGFVAGGGSLLLVAFIGKLIFKKDAMGGGDIKLMAGVGAFIGWERVLFAIFIACFVGSVVGITLILFKKIKKQQPIPFGPYLALGSILTLVLPAPTIIINLIFELEEKFLVKYFFTNL